MYEYSTKLNAERRGCSGLARIIPVAEVAQLICFYPTNPTNPRSILGLQKNGTDAEICAEIICRNGAEPFAVPHANACADIDAESGAIIHAEAFAEPCAEFRAV